VTQWFFENEAQQEVWLKKLAMMPFREDFPSRRREEEGKWH